MYSFWQWMLKRKKSEHIIYGSLVTGLIFVALFFASRPIVARYIYLRQFEPHKGPIAGKILITYEYGIGEDETTERIKIAAKKLNPMLDVRSVRLVNSHEDKIRWMKNDLRFSKNTDPVALAIKKFKPDFLLALQPIQPREGVPNYLTVTLGQDKFIYRDQNNEQQISKSIVDFDAVLSGVPNPVLLERMFAKQKKKLRHMTWYVTSYITDYQPATPRKIFYSGADLWDDRRASIKFKEVFSLLDKTNYFAVCGLNKTWEHMPNSYIGFIPVDGKSLIHKIHEAGVALLLHSDSHIRGRIPTARIFEATSANVVVISDRHPFIEEHFGDNVLYIDTELDAHGIFAQIDQHMQWILNNPRQAQLKAAKCNEIYKQHFSLEQQLLNLMAMHKNNAA